MRTFAAAHAEQLAGGWPHRRALVAATLGTSQGSGKRPEQRAAEVLSRVDPSAVIWTPEVALAYLRGHELRPGEIRPDQLATMAGPAQLDVDELASRLRSWAGRSRYWFVFEHMILLAEALVGADGVVDTICDWLATLERGHDSRVGLGPTFGAALTGPSSLAFLLGFPLLRASADRRDRVRELRARFAPESLVARLLSLVLDGAAGARDLGVDQLFACAFVDDDPELLATVAAGEFRFASLSPRFVWLGGTPLLDHFCQRATKPLPAWYTWRFVEEFGVFAEPGTVALIATLAGKRPCRAAALEWFRVHPEFARAHRDQIHGDSKAAAEIFAVLDG
jgi:hypothetical protein